MIIKRYNCKEPPARWETAVFLLILAVFFVTNLCFLTRFPFVHSDEAWLSGLTRNMMEQRSLAVTEPFFDLKPRWPHAVKSVFHLLQMPFLAAFGYRVESVRLLSLLGGCAALALFWRAARRMCGGRAALASAALLACDAQFVCASHLARQEILLCTVMLGCLLVFLRRDGKLENREVLLLGLLTGLSVGLHPNSFLVAGLCGAVLAMRVLLCKTASWRQLGLYTAVTGAPATLFVAASLAMDPLFPAHYLAYGQSEFGLIVPVGGKVAELGAFLQKLWHRVSGTYFVPELRPQLVLFPLLLAFAAFYALVMRRERPAECQRLMTVVAAVGGVLAGTVLIGRYNQTGFAFFVPLCWLLLAPVCRLFGRWPGRAAFAAAAAAAALSCALCVRPWLGRSYEGYLAKLSALVPPDAKTIGNLNGGFAFENGRLLDYRNLAFLEREEGAFAGYVEANGVEYIAVHDELAYIYSVRPSWNIIYGNLSGWYPQMERFVDERCTEVGGFTDDTYAVRIVSEMDKGKGYGVRVYRVEEPGRP